MTTGAGAVVGSRRGLDPATGRPAPAERGSHLRPTAYWSTFPPGMSPRRRFEIAREVGFEGLEVPTMTGRAEADAVGEAAAATGVAVPTVVNARSLKAELFAEDPVEVEEAVGSLLRSLENARDWGAGAVHFIPGYVRGTVPFETAYDRTQEVLRRRILPVAEELGIVCAMENAWRSLVQGPFEYVRFLDEMESPCLKAFLDTGNAVFGHPEQWIRLTGARVVRLHLKDFRMETGGRFAWSARGRFAFGPIGRGATDWAAVGAALREVGYRGWATCAGYSPILPIRVWDRCLLLLGARSGGLSRAGSRLDALRTARASSVLRRELARLERLR